MYCGIIDLTKLQSPEILNLLLSSDELGLQPLVAHVRMKIIMILLLKMLLKQSD